MGRCRFGPGAFDARKENIHSVVDRSGATE